MMNSKSWYIRCSVVIMLCFISYFSSAQTDSLPGDPGAMTVYVAQGINFGAFTQGTTGGTVTISNNGTRSTTGTVIGLNNISFGCAIFEIDTPQGSIISITNGPDATLTGSNGGSMTMTIGPSSPSSMFMTTAQQPARTPVYIGGTLSVGNAAASPPGTYTGTFYVMFNQE